MASKSLNIPHRFAAGTIVRAYPRDATVPNEPPDSNSLDQATVAADGTLTFTNLPSDAYLTAFARVDGEYRYFPFTVGDPSLGSSGSSVVVAPTDAAIRAAAADLAAKGGGTVFIPPGSSAGAWAPITLASPLTVYKGVTYEGVKPVMTAIDVNPGKFEEDFTFIGGTVLKGDGTFAGITGNAVDQGSPPGNVSTSGLSGAQVLRLGFDTFTDGVRIGAQNIMGLERGRIDDLYIRNCSGWGIALTNFMLSEIGKVDTSRCVNGQYYGVKMPKTTMQPCNSQFTKLFDTTLVPNRFKRGIVFEVTDGGTGAGAVFGGIHVNGIQVNAFGGTPLLSDTATFTNASTSVSVPDGTQYGVGMIVQPTTTGLGYTANQAYVVRSVAGNTLTLSTSRSGALISATGAGTLTLKSYGYPNIEAYSSNTANILTEIKLLDIDSEGTTAAGIYIENAGNSEFDMTAPPPQSLIGFIARNAQSNKIRFYKAATHDFDSLSIAGTILMGDRDVCYNWSPPGMGRDLARGTTSSVWLGESVGVSPTIQQRSGGFAVMTKGVGMQVREQATTATFNGGTCGVQALTPTAPITVTLPTIVGADTTAPGASHVGCVFEFANIGSATATIAAGGGQNFNKVGALTSIAVAPGETLRVTAMAGLYWLARREGAAPLS